MHINKVSLLLIAILASLLLASFPQFFFLADLEAASKDPVKLGTDDRLILLNDLNRGLDPATVSGSVFEADMERRRASAAVDELSSQLPWFSTPSPKLQEQLTHAREDLTYANNQYHLITREIEAMRTHKRSLTPLFSTDAIKEVRAVWTDCQMKHVRVSAEWWAWDTIFDFTSRIFSENEDESLASLVTEAVLSFLFRMSFGAIAASIEFLGRIPFWLREYETSSPLNYAVVVDQLRIAEGLNDASKAMATGAAGNLTNHSLLLMSVPTPEVGFFRSGLIGFVKALLFYMFAVLACIGGFLIHTIAVWAIPIGVLLLLANRHSAQDRKDE